MGAVCQSQLPLPQWEWCPTVGLTPCSCPWPSSPATLTAPSSCGRAVQWCLANPLIAREVSIRDQCKPNIKYINTNNIVIILKCDSRIKNITNQHMKINVKCLFKVFHSNSGEKG